VLDGLKQETQKKKDKENTMEMPTKFMLRAKLQRGQGMTEYALILALVSVVAIATLTSLGTAVTTQLGKVVTAL